MSISPEQIVLEDLAPNIEISTKGWLNENSLAVLGSTTATDSILSIIDSTNIDLVEGVTDFAEGIKYAPDLATSIIRTNTISETTITDEIGETLDDDLLYDDDISDLLPKTIKQTITVDTRFRPNYDELSTNFTYIFPETQKEILNMRIGNIEMPTTYYTISEELGNNKMLIISDASMSITYTDMSASWLLTTQQGYIKKNYYCGTVIEITDLSKNQYENQDTLTDHTEIYYDPSISNVSYTMYSDSTFPNTDYNVSISTGTMKAQYGLGAYSTSYENTGYSTDLSDDMITFKETTTENTYTYDYSVYKNITIQIEKTYNDWYRFRRRTWKNYDASYTLFQDMQKTAWYTSVDDAGDIEQINTIFPEGNPNDSTRDLSGNVETEIIYKTVKYESFHNKKYIDLKSGNITNFTPTKRAWLITIPDGYYDDAKDGNKENAEKKINDAISIGVPGAIDENDNFAAFENPQHYDWLNYVKYSDLIYPTQNTYNDIKFNIFKNSTFTTGTKNTTISITTPKFTFNEELSLKTKNGGTQFGTSDTYTDNSLNGTPYEQMAILLSSSYASSVSTFNIGTNPKKITHIRFNIDNCGNIDNITNLQLKLGWMLGFKTNEYEIK
tara:strand:- start:189 stop:2030 length:1842 start_codon:yes stop_codon:yes gene_type:complete